MGRMHNGEWLTRGTVWVALSLYVGGEIVKAGRGGGARRGAARWLNNFGCTAFLAHVTCAFHFYHGWSHSAAYAETARQTAELVGKNWGGGLYLNYLFALVWVAEVIGSWISPKGHIQRPDWLLWTMRAFFFFMIFNGTVLFPSGMVRWFGFVLCLVLAVCWWPHRSRIAGSPDPSKSA